MAWRELRFVCDAAVADAISDALIAAGALSVSIEDADAGSVAEKALFGEPGSATEAAWTRNTVVVLMDTQIDDAALIANAARNVGLATPPNYDVRAVAAQDWVKLTQSQFDPIRISKKLWIVPSWHTPPDPAALAIQLDPGLAFGTGTHPTTRMCLEWLEQHLTPGDAVLDYGCGSGILGIAAVLLGARSVTATDIDPHALSAAQDNAISNHIEITIRSPDQLPASGYSVVIANILTNPLKVLAPALCARIHEGGRLTLSGILESQASDVIAAYSSLVKLNVWRVQDGWVCLSGEKLPALPS